MFRFNTLVCSLIFFLFVSGNAFAQCAMCRAVLETEEGGVKAAAVNDGIVYLMVIPYLLVAVIGFLVYRVFQNKKAKNA